MQFPRVNSQKKRLRWTHLSLLLVMVLVLTGFTNPLSPTLQQQVNPEDWPTHAGGFERHGSAASSPILNANHLFLAWKRFLGERIEVEMEPVVVGNLLYIGVMNGKLYALDTQTGNTAWVYEAGEGIANTPSVADINGRLMIFFGAINGKFFALDALDGQEVWSYTTGDAILSTPSVVDGLVLVGSLDHYFYAWDAESGKLSWKFQASGPISSTSAVGEIEAGKKGIFFSSGDNVAYALDEDGQLLWQHPMEGTFTKRTYVVYANGVAIFVTRKPGIEYSEVLSDPPAILQGQRQSGEVVLDAWADYYQKYPTRRPLYYLDGKTGEDLWAPAKNKTAYVPLYIPYWGEYMPVVDQDGIAWLPSSGSGGDHGLDHDMRLWKIDLKTGIYTQVADQDHFTPRFDEVGRPTLVGTRYYQTISEDIAYYDTANNQLYAGVFGNGFDNHRKPIELDERSPNQLFGGMYKHFARFASSSPGGFGGANDAASPLVVAGNQAYFTAWGHLYALSARPAQAHADYGQLDLANPPAANRSVEDVRTLLNQQIQALVDSGEHIDPVARMWAYHPLSMGVFWQEGDVVRSLAEALPYLDVEVANQLKGYLKTEVEDYLLNPTYYEYRYACIDYDQKRILDPCEEGENTIQVGWYWNSQNLVAERLYAMYQYANNSGDWATIEQNWPFISKLFTGFEEFWDAEAGFFLFPEWQTGPFNPTYQMGATFAMKGMAQHMGDSATERKADQYLQTMQQQRVFWGKYVRSLYADGTLKKLSYDQWEDWAYIQGNQPIPIEGYLGDDNDYRQVYSLTREDGELVAQFDSPMFAGAPYHLIGYHPFYQEFNDLIQSSVKDELSDYVAAVEAIAPFWYMGDYSHAPVLGELEEDSGSPLLATDMFQAKAYVLGYSFDDLVGSLPWTFENYGAHDIFRVQNLTALLRIAGVEPHPVSETTPTSDLDFSDMHFSGR